MSIFHMLILAMSNDDVGSSRSIFSGPSSVNNIGCSYSVVANDCAEVGCFKAVNDLDELGTIVGVDLSE